jgi:hypothetical protein
MKLRALRKSCNEDSGILMRHRDAHEALEWEVVVLPRLFDDVQQYSVLSSSLALSFWTDHDPRRITRINLIRFVRFDCHSDIHNIIMFNVCSLLIDSCYLAMHSL